MYSTREKIKYTFLIPIAIIIGIFIQIGISVILILMLLLEPLLLIDEVFDLWWNKRPFNFISNYSRKVKELVF